MKLWRALLGGQQEIVRYSVDQYANDLAFAFAGNRYLLGGGTGWTKTEDIETSFTGYINSIYKSNGVVFAIILARMLLFSEARFCWFDIADNGEDGRPAGRDGLDVIERPWPNGSTGELLSRMEQDVSLGGNFYAVREPNRLRRLRPDWLTIVLTAPPAEAVESDVAGYWYHPGRSYSNAGEPAPMDEVYLPDEVAHFSPIPDPDAQYRGMSWLTPVVREVMADKAATDHKLAFFENGATLGVVISAKENLTNAQFKEWKANFAGLHGGTNNAYKPLFLASPVDTSVTTANMQQLEFKVTQGAGETRLCAAGGVPPIIVGLSEGLASATYSNYGMARRKFGDGWAHPQWKMASTALSSIVEAPRPDVRLGVNTRGIAFLREDAKDLAEIMQIQASAVSSFITAGYEPDSAAAAVDANDLTLLKHTGLTSVQLMPPGSQDTDSDGTPDAEAAAADEYAQALDEFRAEFADDEPYIERKYYDIRVPKGHEGGGRFRKMSDRIGHALNEWLSGKGEDDDPLEGFSREQLRLASKEFGITARRGASAEELKLGLLKDARARHRGATAAKSPDAGKPVRFTLTGGSVDPAKAREVEVENKIRAAYRKLRPNAKYGSGNEWLGLADLRDELGENINRREIDAALRRMARAHNDPNAPDAVRVVPIANTKALKPRDREAAFQIGESDVHMVSFADPSPRPVPDSKLRDLDVGVFQEGGKVSLWEVSDSGERRRRVALVDDLAGLAAWADEHGESELAGWARKERGGEAPKAPDVPAKATKTAKKAVPGGGASDFVPGGAKHIDLRQIAEGLDFSDDDGSIADAQQMLNDGKSPAAVARELRERAQTHADSTGIRYGNWDSGYKKTPEQLAERQRLRAQGMDRVRRLRELAERLDATRRPTAPHKPAAPAAKPVDLPHLRTLDPEAARDELDLRKVDDLKALLREQKLPVSGRKRDLVDRLVEHLGGPKAGAVPAPAAKADEPAVRTFPPGQHSWSGHDGLDVTDEEEANYLSLPLTKQAEIQSRLRSGTAWMTSGARGTYFGTLPDPSVVVSPEREAEIRAAVEQVVRQRGTRFGERVAVSMDALREGLAGRFDRAEVDNVIQKLNRSTDWYAVTEANQKVLTPRARLAAVVLGGMDKHALAINTFGPPPVAKKADVGTPPTMTAADILASLPADLTPAQKRARLRSRGVPKEQIDALVPLAPRKRVAARSEGFDAEDLARSEGDDTYDEELSPMELEAMAGEESAEDPTLDEIQAMADEDDGLTDDDAPGPDEVGDADEDLDEETLARIHELLNEDDDPEAQRADLALGRERLHRYWTVGKGLAKWLGHPHPWTSLYRHLRKYVGSERAKRMAAKWVHEVTGDWPGSDAHRVATGHKPRGHRIGPG